MESEVRTLKHELTRTREDLKLATKRCRELVRELDSLTACHSAEQNLRDQQLSKILRALLVLESRLRQEQKSIRQQLCEKDNVIKNQQLEIAKLRRYTKNYIKSKRDQIVCKSPSKSPLNLPENEDLTNFDDEGLAHDIQKLKREIITKFSVDDVQEMRTKDFGVRKNDSFAGSDVSKESLTSDGSIVTTTTDGLTDCPSLISTEGFCEGESTDVSPGSTLNKRKSRIGSESDGEGPRTVLEGPEDHDDVSKRRNGVTRTEPLPIFNDQVKIVRSDSKDDGMDCNYLSEEDGEGEPIYVNSWSENNERNLRESETRFIDDSQNNNHGKSQITDEKSPEDPTGNWYSDPDEDRLNDDIIRHNTYRPNSNHNSVLECVNQILLRDMEEEENVLSVSRKFKHRGRIVSFQAARLSDIESVGSEMERRNSEETQDKDTEGSEDEYGMKISNSIINEDNSDRAIPILIIEPKNDFENSQKNEFENSQKNIQNLSPKYEKIEEKKCLEMSTKGLTIAKNLDYEDIESLPEVSPPPRTPPALPPKPQFIHNTLILKKIPSPSFLIDETRKKTPETPDYVKKIFGISKKPPIPRCLKFEKSPRRISVDNGNSNDDNVLRVTNIVRHFEEFKIGESEKKEKKMAPESEKMAGKDEEMDIRQNFEEFNLDDCDLSDDPDRHEGDGSERLGNGVFNRQESDKDDDNGNSNGIYDHFLEATGLSTKSILTPSRLLSNHKSMLKPKDVKYKSMIKGAGGFVGGNQTQVRHWTGPFV